MSDNVEDRLIHNCTENGQYMAVRETTDEAETLRWLDFGDGGVQSLIDPGNPQHLVSPLNQAMLAGLLFRPAPRQALLLGTGGGAIARFLSHRLPECRGDAVEHSAAVAKIARRFFDFPASDSGWTLHITKAQDFIAQCRQAYDLIVLDIAENQRTPTWFGDLDFLDHCRQRLSPEGVLVINLLPADAMDFARSLAPIRNAFPGCTACLSVPDQRSILAFAFREPVSACNIDTRIPTLEAQWDLPFSEFFQRMQAENPPGSGVF